MPELDQSNPAVSHNFHKKRSENRGDVLICGLWTDGIDCIVNSRVTDIDAKSNCSRDPVKVFEARERERRKTMGHALSSIIISLRSWSTQMAF
jgi:hypothetical protein